MRLIEVSYRGESLGLFFYTEESARYYLDKTSQAYHYARDRFTFQWCDPLASIPDHAETRDAVAGLVADEVVEVMPEMPPEGSPHWEK